MRYFRRDGDEWLVDASLRRMVTFRRFNLLDSFGWLDDLDIVLLPQCADVFRPRHAAGCAGAHRRDHGAGRAAGAGRAMKRRNAGCSSACADGRGNLSAEPSRCAARARSRSGECGRSAVPAPGWARAPARPVPSTSRWNVCSSANSPPSAACSTMSVKTSQQQPGGKLTAWCGLFCWKPSNPAWPRHAATASARHSGLRRPWVTPSLS